MCSANYNRRTQPSLGGQRKFTGSEGKTKTQRIRKTFQMETASTAEMRTSKANYIRITFSAYVL